MSTKKKRQHFVPQGYLRRFENENSTDKVSRIWVVDRFKDDPFEATVQGVASRDFFYDSVIDKGISEFDSQGLENLLEREERKFYRSLGLVDQALSVGLGTSEEAKPGLAWYMYLQFIRTYKFRESLDIPNDNTIEDYRKIAQIYAFARRDLATKFIHLCLSKSWVIYRMTGNLYAFTSDNPVIFSFDVYADAIEYAKRGEDLVFSDLKGMRIIFPLDARHVLFLYDKKSRPDMVEKDGKVLEFDSSEAYSFWGGMCSNCERQIHLPRKESLAEVIKILLNFDPAKDKIVDILLQAIRHVSNANTNVKGTKLNSYSGYLANSKVKPLFDTVKKLGE